MRAENINNKADNLFTEQEARKCTIVGLRSHTEGGLHRFWEVTVLDNWENEYVWEDWDTSSTASVTDFQNAILARLVKTSKL